MVYLPGQTVISSVELSGIRTKLLLLAKAAMLKTESNDKQTHKIKQSTGYKQRWAIYKATSKLIYPVQCHKHWNLQCQVGQK